MNNWGVWWDKIAIGLFGGYLPICLQIYAVCLLKIYLSQYLAFFIKSHVCQNVRLLAISSGWVGGVYSGLKNHAKYWIKNVVYTSQAKCSYSAITPISTELLSSGICSLSLGWTR